MWNDAKRKNPDPNKFIPVPLFGFDGLKRRANVQTEEQEVHELKLSGDDPKVCQPYQPEI